MFSDAIYSQGRILMGCGGSYVQRQPDVHVQGTGVEPIHCYIENINGTVSLYPLGEMTSVDGLPVATPIRLTQGKYSKISPTKIVLDCVSFNRTGSEDFIPGNRWVRPLYQTCLITSTVLYWRPAASKWKQCLRSFCFRYLFQFFVFIFFLQISLVPITWQRIFHFIRVRTTAGNSLKPTVVGNWKGGWFNQCFFRVWKQRAL